MSSSSSIQDMELAVKTALEQLFTEFGKSEEERKRLSVCIEENLVDLSKKATSASEKSPRKPIRVYLDGCFDLMHAGHYNAIRQAKALGDVLVVGVHSDEEILRNKGPTTLNDQERLYAVNACKWVDEVVFDVPYSPSVELLDRLNCDFGVHGDDMPTDASGNSAYGDLLKAGRLKLIKRTEGVSTTDLVGRMLLMTRDHHIPIDSASQPKSVEDLAQFRAPSSTFLPTTRRIVQFANRTKSVRDSTRIVYVDGNFDLFAAGHIELLEKAKALGDFLLVGIHDDQTVNSYMGDNYPIMNLHERVLNVLSCKFVDEVIMGAPARVTRDLIVSMNIKVVAHDPTISSVCEEKNNSYEVPRAMGILQTVQTSLKLTTELVVQRILTHQERYKARNKTRVKKEADYFQNKSFVQEL
jgi:ethanolamine-phosphate cytidylyltransferase